MRICTCFTDGESESSKAVPLGEKDPVLWLLERVRKAKRIPKNSCPISHLTN